MQPINLTHAFVVFALFGLIWTIQLVHYPMFKLVEAPHWPRFHRYHSRNITLIVFPLMLVELLTSIQLFIGEESFTNTLALGCSAATWLLTFVVFMPLHHKVAVRPDANVFSKLYGLNWIRTGVWTIASVNVFTNLLSVAPSSIGLG